MEQKGLRGSAPARIDDKGRLKVPTIFRSVIHDQQGPDVFVTSLTGDCVRIYPMTAWLEVERKLSNIPENHPARLKFLDRVNYYGQTGELVFGRISYLDVWNEERFVQKLQRDPWTDEDGLRLSEHGI